MDCMREEEDREINHHGRSVNVDQTQRRQNEPVEARNPEEENGEKNGEENEQIRKIFVVSANSSHSVEDKQVVNILGSYLIT